MHTPFFYCSQHPAPFTPSAHPSPRYSIPPYPFYSPSLPSLQWPSTHIPPSEFTFQSFSSLNLRSFWLHYPSSLCHHLPLSAHNPLSCIHLSHVRLYSTLTSLSSPSLICLKKDPIPKCPLSISLHLQSIVSL